MRAEMTMMGSALSVPRMARTISSPGHCGQHEIGDNDVRALLAQKQEALGAREGLAAAVAATLQMRADHLVDRGVVLDDEYVGDGFHGKQDNTRGCVGVGIFKQS